MLDSLYAEAIKKKGSINDVIDELLDKKVDIDSKWNNEKINPSQNDYILAAGDGSFNKKKFLTSNFCAVGAESRIYDGEIKKIDDSDIFEISNVSIFLGNFSKSSNSLTSFKTLNFSFTLFSRLTFALFLAISTNGAVDSQNEPNDSTLLFITHHLLNLIIK